MPRVIFEFQRSHHGTLPTQYRIIDRSDASESGPGRLNTVIEKRDGMDAMRSERWVDAGPEGIEAFLNEAVYFDIRYAKPIPEPVRQPESWTTA